MENWKKGDRVLLSTKDLVFKERLARKLVEVYDRTSLSYTRLG